MAFNFSFFGDQEHRVFNYRPRYYDKDADERRQFFGTEGEKPAEGEYKPGSSIQGSFRDGKYQKTSGLTRTNRAQKIIGAVGLILFFMVLLYIVKFYSVL